MIVTIAIGNMNVLTAIMYGEPKQYVCAKNVKHGFCARSEVRLFEENLL